MGHEFVGMRAQIMTRIAVTTVLNDPFAEYFLVLLYSIKKHNPAFDHDLIVMHSRTLSPLSEANQQRIRSLYPKVSFRLIDEAPYARFFPVTPPRLHPALLKLEVFRLKEYDRVVFLDADMLCLGDLCALMNLDVAFGASLAGKDREKKEKLAGKMRFRLGFNTGVMIIGKKYLNEETWNSLSHSPLKPCPTADQDILIRYFRWRRVYCLDHRYNYHAEFFWKGGDAEGPERSRGVKILHYAGAKPLEKPEEPRMKIWFTYRDEIARSL